MNEASMNQWLAEAQKRATEKFERATRLRKWANYIAIALLCLAGWFGYGIDQNFYHTDRLTTGHVVETYQGDEDNPGGGFVQFKVGQITYDAHGLSDKDIGKTALVRYNSNNPERNHISGNEPDFLPVFLAALFGGVAAYVGFQPVKEWMREEES
jgi:hypothetical protein